MNTIPQSFCFAKIQLPLHKGAFHCGGDGYSESFLSTGKADGYLKQCKSQSTNVDWLFLIRVFYNSLGGCSDTAAPAFCLLTTAVQSDLF